MNGKRTDFGDDTSREHFDPELAQLFSAASESPLSGTAFVADVLRSLERERRHQLLWRVAGTLMALTAAAFAAPYVGERTFDAVDWLAQDVSSAGAALASPVACAAAALITWLIARRGLH
jgi:hypothetical protein